MHFLLHKAAKNSYCFTGLISARLNSIISVKTCRPAWAVLRQHAAAGEHSGTAGLRQLGLRGYFIVFVYFIHRSVKSLSILCSSSQTGKG